MVDGSKSEATKISDSSPACRAGALTNCANRPSFDGLKTEETNGVLSVEGLSNDAYHSEPEVSSSQERTAWRSWELFYRRHVTKQIPGFSSASTELGQDCHDWFETLDDSLSWLVTAPAEVLTPTGQIGKKAKEWAEKEGIEGRLVSQSHRDKVAAIAAAIKANKPAMELREQATELETSYFWKLNGLPIRCRNDAGLPCGHWLDLKTSSCGNIDREFAKSVHDYGYNRQVAFYELFQEQLYGKPTGFTFIVVQTAEPFQVRCKTLPRDYVDASKRSVRKVLDEIHQRTALEHWVLPEAEEIQELSIPQWMYPQEGNR